MKLFEHWWKEYRGDVPTKEQGSITAKQFDFYRWEKEAYEAGQKSFETQSRFFFVRYTYRSPSSIHDIVGNHAFEFDGSIDWREMKDVLIDRVKAHEFRPLLARLVIDHIIEIQERDYRTFVEQMSAKISP